MMDGAGDSMMMMMMGRDLWVGLSQKGRRSVKAAGSDVFLLSLQERKDEQLQHTRVFNEVTCSLNTQIK